MTTLPDTVARDPQRTIAELRRQLDERTAERDEALEQQTATAEVLQVINSARGDLAPVFDAIVEKATRLCGASSGALYIRDGDLVRIAAMRDAPAALAEFVSREPVRLTDMLGRGSLPPAFIHVADMSVGEAYRRRVPIAVACVELGGIRTLLAVPLLKDGCVVGVFIIYRQEVRPFSDRQIALLQSFAVQAVIAMENARLLGELRQRTADLQESLEFQTATSDVLKVISGSAFELAPVLETVVNTAARLCRADQAVIYRLQDGEYQWAAGNSLVAEYERIERNNKIRPSMGTLVGRAALSRSTVHILDAWTDPLYEAKDDARLANLHTMLGVPLLREGVPIGVIGLGRVRVEPYSEKEIELVCSFADQAVIAMENARLLGELRQSTADLQESLRYQTATGDVLKVISRSTFDLQPVLDTLVETAVQLCEADSAMISSREGEVFRVRATSSFSPEFAAFMRGRLLPAGRGSVSGRAGIEGQVVHVHDVASDPEYALPETLTLDKARTLLGVPLLREGVVVGVIALSRHRMQPFSERQIELVRSFADQAVIAMENARLLDEIRTARDTAEVALERQTATSDILKVIAGSPSDTRPVFDAIAARANRLLGGFSTAVWRFEGDKGYLAAFTPTNPEADAALQAMSPLAITDLVFVQLSNGQIAQLPDTEEGPPRLRDIARLRGYRAMLFVPLMAQGAPIGFVSVTRKEVGSFNLDDVQLLQTFADQGVIAIQNAQLFNELTRRTGELEEALEQQTATAEILRAISQSPTDVQPVLDVVAGAARRFCGANDVIIMLRDDGELVIAAHEGPLVARRGRLVLARDSTAGRAVIDGQTCHLPDIEALDPVEFAMARNLAAQRGFRATVAAPLMREGSAVGAVLLRKAEAGPFTPQQIALLETFAAQAVIAIENVRLFTELKESLERLKAAQANLIQSEKMASLGQLTAGIAHEIKNPLNFVNNFAGLSVELLGELKEIAAPVLAGMDEGARADFGETMELITGNLDKIAEHGRRADGIVKSMLSHSRGGTGDRRSADVNGLLEESLNLAFHGARAQDQNFNITLERDFDPSLGAIELVPQDITRVFLNLCGNGFYAANKRRRDAGQAEYRPVLKVATRELGHAVEVRIRDNGIGIPPEVRGKLFQPFFTTKPTGEGTGLGLSISYDIVTQQHGGTIDVESEVGDFTEFIIRLPRRRPAAKIGAA